MYKFNPLTGELDLVGDSSGGGGVASVNGDTGPAVVLDAGDVGADPAGTAQALFDTLGNKYVRTTRFEVINSGTSGTVTLPADSEVVLDDFGGTTDAVIAQASGGKPYLLQVQTSTNEIVATSFNTSGDWVLTGTPSAYPITIVYRVRQLLSDFDSSSSNIFGIATYDQDATNIQIFTSSGTWNKPPNARLVKVIGIGGGGGGGSGRRGASTTVRCGGGGGAAGVLGWYEFNALDLLSAETVTIGAGGTGGAFQTTSDNNGNPGTPGGNTTFGAHFKALGGNPGNGGTNATGIGGTNVITASNPWAFIQIAGASASVSGGGGGNATGQVGIAPGAGAAGGGITVGDSPGNGGTGSGVGAGNVTGQTSINGGAGSSGTGIGGSNVIGPYGQLIGAGGGGGGANELGNSGRAGPGGAGGMGAGGGGAGASVNTSSTATNAKGGDGGNGWLVVVTYF